MVLFISVLWIFRRQRIMVPCRLKVSSRGHVIQPLAENRSAWSRFISVFWKTASVEVPVKPVSDRLYSQQKHFFPYVQLEFQGLQPDSLPVTEHHLEESDSGLHHWKGVYQWYRVLLADSDLWHPSGNVERANVYLLSIFKIEMFVYWALLHQRWAQSLRWR